MHAQIFARADVAPTKGNGPGSLYFGTSPTGSNVAVQRMAIRSNGNVGIGADFSDPQALLHVNGDALARGSWRQESDIRLKEDINPLKDSLDKILGLEGVSFKFKNNQEQGTQIGVIAQDVEKVVPEVVSTGEDGYKSVSYQNLVPLLIEAMKEQQKQIEELKKELNELKSQTPVQGN